MKTFLPLFFGLLIYCGYAQPYLPILEENNQWNVVYWSFWSGGYENINEVTIFGDEVIDGKTYKVVFLNGVASNCRLREDDGVVYSYEQQINDEKIMLDLNVEIDDVINEDIFCLGGGGGTIWEYKVVDIHVDFIAGENRKVVVIEGFDIFGDPFGYNEFWIEGIGSTRGLVPFGYNYDFDNLLTCFINDGLITYFNDFTTCTPELSIGDFSSEEILLYPNPVNELSIIQLPADAFIDRIQILDIHGRIVSAETVSKAYYTIDTMNYRSGVYFYQVFSDKAIIKTAQFIVK